MLASALLRELRSGGVLLMDGAMGTELQRAGLGDGQCAELWNVTHPERVRAVHDAYLAAGARCLVTNTFQGNPTALARHGLQDRLHEINAAGVALARAAAGGRAFVLGSIGPVADLDVETLARIVHSLAGADALLFETWSFSEPDARARGSAESLACAAGSQETWNPNALPVLLSFAFRRDSDGRLCAGDSSPESVAAFAQVFGAAALGANCGREISIADMAEILRRHCKQTDLPLFARPNAGTPVRTDEGWIYPHSPALMANSLPLLLEAGATIIGGCCGTTPAHIAAFRKQLKPD